MSPPTVVTTTHQRRRNAVIPEDMIQGTCDVLATLGVDRSRSWIMRTIRAWQRASIPVPFGDALVVRLQLNAQQCADVYARSECRYVLEYADPTGEAAVRNVMATRPQRGAA